MKKSIFIVTLLLIITVLSCSKETINGSGTLVSEFRDVATFNKVSSEGVFEVTITESDIQSVEITADNNIMHRVRTEVVNNELRLYLDNNNYNNISLQATIYVQNINSIKNSGVGNISVFDVTNAENFSVKNTGTGNITILGNAESLSIINEGSGDFYGFDFTVNNCNVDIEGTGDCEVNCSNNLNVQIEGSGNVFYVGYPTINTHISGSGSVINAN